MKVFDLESHKFADVFPMIEGNELENLKDDIKEHGQLEPVILYEDKILDGRNRYRACKELGLTPKTDEYKGEKPLEFVISMNLKRRHLSESQRAVLALDVLPMLEEEARKRQVRSQENRNLVTEKVREQEILKNKISNIKHNENLSKNEKEEQIIEAKSEFSRTRRANESSFKAGKIMQVNEKYVREAKKLKETSPELFEEVRMGHKNFSEIKKEQRAEKLAKQREEIQKESFEKPIGDYDVIVIDPPWNYQEDSVYDADGFRGTCPYPTMSIEQIKNIKLPAKEDCVLWLWTTNKHIFDCREILNEWGFEIKSILTWDKEHIAIGRWLRSQTEHCILAIKGKPYYQNTKYGTIIREKRTEHSVKPELFYKMVEEICAGRKLDYFARKKKEGWDVWGNEVK